MTERLQYKLTLGGDKPDTVIAFDPESDNPVKQADSSHAHWSQILVLLERGDRAVFDLFDVAGGVTSRLQALSDRVSYNGNDILWDGDPIDNTLAKQVIAFLEDGDDNYKALVAFWEKIAANPSENSREQLFNFLQQGKFTITDDGDIVGYKGVERNNRDDATDETPWQSVSRGTAYVDGVKFDGQIPNGPGAVVSMPRSEVVEDPNVTCHVGLHVGTWDYAFRFGNRDLTLEVHVNPAHVVSVPRDGGKMRVTQYKVVDLVTAPYDSNVVPKASQPVAQVGYASVF